MDMEHLTLVKGQSQETIEAKLKEAGINYKIVDDTRSWSLTDAPYFRKGHIEAEQGWREILHTLGFPDYGRKNIYHYHAKYEINEGFDFSQLKGKLTFDKGLLVEITKVRFCD